MFSTALKRVKSLSAKAKHSAMARKAYHAGHFAGHVAYFAAVALEGHGTYALAAAVMLGVTLIGTVFSDT